MCNIQVAYVCYYVMSNQIGDFHKTKFLPVSSGGSLTQSSDDTGGGRSKGELNYSSDI